MLRIFKPRSPMSMGSWCLTIFGGLASAAVGADLLGRRRTARGLGAANAVVGGYLGSYTGVLLASTAVPVWARSRLLLGPIFVSTATLTGAAATRLVLSATGTPPGHPTRDALNRVENAAMATELLLSEVNHHHLGSLASVLDDGVGASWFQRAKWLARAGLAAQLTRRRPAIAEHISSVCFMAAALCYRHAWVRSGVSSAHDDEAVARTARERAPARPA
jgi:formate-dependent nitrite reductase membrane component NrfD